MFNDELRRKALLKVFVSVPKMEPWDKFTKLDNEQYFIMLDLGYAPMPRFLELTVNQLWELVQAFYSQYRLEKIEGDYQEEGSIKVITPVMGRNDGSVLERTQNDVRCLKQCIKVVTEIGRHPNVLNSGHGSDYEARPIPSVYPAIAEAMTYIRSVAQKQLTTHQSKIDAIETLLEKDNE